MAHSNQLREFVLTDEGVKLIPAYIGPGGVFTFLDQTKRYIHRKVALQAFFCDFGDRFTDESEMFARAGLQLA
jgi:hypothetical protein